MGALAKLMLDRLLSFHAFQDCHDNSDEADCVTEKVTLSVYPERVTVRQGQEAVFRCRDEGELRLGVSWSREGHQTLPPGAMDSRGRLSLINVQSNYSGVYVCSVSEEYKQSFRAQQVVYLTVQPSKCFLLSRRSTLTGLHSH